MHELRIKIPQDFPSDSKDSMELFDEYMAKEAMKLRNMYFTLAIGLALMFYHTGHFAFLYGVMLTLCLVVLFAVSSQ
jgi:hypothetical protein